MKNGLVTAAPTTILPRLSTGLFWVDCGVNDCHLLETIHYVRSLSPFAVHAVKFIWSYLFAI